MSITKEEMREVLREFSSTLRPSSPSGFSGGTGGQGGTGLVGKAAETAFNVLGEAAGQSAEALRALATGSYSASDALKNVGAVLKEAGVPFTNQLQQMGQQVIGANESLKQTGRAGVDFAGDLGKFNKAVVDSGVDQEKFNRILRESGNQYSGVGLTMNNAAENVLGFSRDLQETPAIEMMKRAGTTQQEVADLAMVSLKERRGIDLNDKIARQEMLENTIKLSGEMNEVARLTGVSRDEQMKKLAKDKENVMVQAELMGMDKDATNRYDMLKTKLGPLGESVSKLTDEIFTGGIRTQEGANRMAALGPAGKQLEDAILLQKNARTAEDKIRAEAAMNEAKAAVARYQQSEQFLSQVRLDRSAVGDAAREMMAQNAELKGRATAAATAAGATAPGQRPPSDAEIQQSRIEQARRDTARVDAAGKPIEGAGISTALNQVQERIYQESKAAADVLREINTKTGTLIQNSQTLNEKLSPRKPGPDGSPMRREDLEKGTIIGTVADPLGQSLKEINDAIGKIPNATPSDKATVSETNPTPLRRNRADGGPVQPGEPYWVGEEGPELVTFETPGEVIPTDEIANFGKEKERTPFEDMNKMFASMQTKVQSKMPDFGQMFESMEVDFPDIESLIADKFPEMAEIDSLMPDFASIFSTAMPTVDDFEQTMPDFANLFTNSLPSTDDITQAMPDFDVLTSELASISPMSQLEGLSLPTPEAIPEAPKFDIDFDAFGSEITKALTPPSSTEEPTVTGPLEEPTDTATLNDVKEQLVQLNTNILELIAHSAAAAENTGMAAKATRDLNGNLFA
jgi:hypothetical protein